MNYQEIWGVDTAMRVLRPHAKFRLENRTFTKWDDPTGQEPPSWDEINEQIKKDKELWDIMQKSSMEQ